jgi:membrane-associated phospholipid phosphatase
MVTMAESPAAAAQPLPRLARVQAAAQSIAKRLGPRLGLGLIAALIVVVLFGALASEVREGDTQNFDDSVRMSIHGVASPQATKLLFFATQLGAPLVLLPLTLVCSLLFLHWRRIRAAILLTVTMAGVTFLSWLLKLIFQRARPVPFFGITTPASYSFPSGHSLASFCFYGALAALLTARLRSPVLRGAVWAAAIVIIVAVGFSRLYLGMHYPSDVIGGYATGFVWVLAVASADRIFRPADERGSAAAVAEPPPGGPS